MRRSYALSPSVTSRVPHGLVFAAHVRGLRCRFYPPSASRAEPHTPAPPWRGGKNPGNFCFQAQF